MKKGPPEFALKFLRWYCREEYLDEIEGDLLELYEQRQQQAGSKADGAFLWEVLLHFRPEYIRSFRFRPSLIQYGMLKNYFKTTLRGIARHKTFSFINIAGLSLGMLTFLFIFLWVQDEKGVDNFHENSSRLYNLYQTVSGQGKVQGEFMTHYNVVDNKRNIPLADVRQAIPEIEYLNFYATGYELPWGHPETFQIGDKIHKLKGSRAGKDFFKMFDFPVIAGDREAPLEDISSIAISKSMSDLFFDSPEEAIGKSIRYENRLDFKIAAVFEDVTSQSTFQFEFLLNWASHMTRLDWASNRTLTTFQLRESADPVQVEQKINRFMEAYLDPNANAKYAFGLQPFKDRYLQGNFINGKPISGRIEYVQIFSGVALFILLLACINFMNLSTARSERRAKEVGVRKVIGSARSNLIWQFIGESIIMSMIALLLALLAMRSLLPYFNAFTGKEISIPFSEPSYWLVAFGLMLLTGIIAGSYPAFLLSSFQPIKTLKGTFQNSGRTNWLRKGMTVFQFSLSIFLLIAALVVSRQTGYVKNAHLGYDRENLVYVRVEGELAKQQKYNLFKRMATELPSVSIVDRSSEAPHAMGFVVDEPIKWEGKLMDDKTGFKPSSVGYDFIKLMNLEIVQGRDFSKLVATDSASAFIVNEEAVKQMGMKDPIGKRVSAWAKEGRIVGVLKDYHTHSMHESIRPLIIDVKEYENFGVVLIRTEPGQTEKALADLEKIYRQINPNYPFDYQFIDQEYQALYESEQLVERLSNIFAILAIFVSCLGLLGLAMYSAGRRIREISIRKILGASAQQIVLLLSKDFLLLIGLSFAVAIPLSWLSMHNWLENFAYRIELSWWIFAFAGLAVIVIAFLIISSQSLKVAYSNPVDTLKAE